MILGVFNFDKIGAKLKGFAKWVCWIEVILIWVVSAVFFLILISDSWLASLAWVPLVFAVIGSLLTWTGRWMLYAFGELVDKAAAIEANTSDGVRVLKKAIELHEENTYAQPLHNRAKGAERKKEPILSQSTNNNQREQKKPITNNTDLGRSEINRSDLIFTCPNCKEDVSFMGYREEDFAEQQCCPFCNSKLEYNSEKSL